MTDVTMKFRWKPQCTVNRAIRKKMRSIKSKQYFIYLGTSHQYENLRLGLTEMFTFGRIIVSNVLDCISDHFLVIHDGFGCYFTAQ